MAYLLVVPIVAGMILLDSWCLMHLWDWFIVPLGVKSITMPWAAGVAMVAHMLAHQSSDSDEDKALTRLTDAVLRPVIALAIGWMIHKWWM